jgi:uncharacterized protein (DUF58 family)
MSSRRKADGIGSSDRRTRRWWFADAVVLLSVAVGAITAQSAPFLVAVVGVGFVTFARLWEPPVPSFRVDRDVSDPEPVPGDCVEITVTIHLEDGPVTDVRIVDGVPAPLEVVDGSPRHATALRSGERVQFSYAVRARRGQFGFDHAIVLVRDPAGAFERELELETETILTCYPPLSEVPLRSQTTQYAGQIETDAGGEGLEFHGARGYRPGDDISRIDWNRLARTGELATVEFRQERAAAVVLVIDARPAAYWAPVDGERHAVERAVAAAGQVFAELHDHGDQVGITALGAEGCWLDPGSGNRHDYRARKLLATHPALSAVPPDDAPPELAIEPDHDSVDVGRLRQRLGADAQVIIFSPLADDAVSRAVRLLNTAGHAVTVISPDVTADGTHGQRLARLQRRNRIHHLREAGVRVIEWGPDRPLVAALAEAGVIR